MTSVDGKTPGFGGSHMLSSAVRPTSGTNLHSVMVGDDIMPRTPDGAPVHEAVWDSLIFR